MTYSGMAVKNSTAIDYITVTSRDKKGGDSLLGTYNRHKEGSQRGTRFFGFDCIKDENGLTWGKRVMDGFYIFIASGEVAGEVWRKVVPVAYKVTRIDLAVDCWFEKPCDIVRQSARVPMSPALDTRLKYTYITGMAGSSRARAGDTLYCGSRQSAQFGRLYDKGLQQKTSPPGKWFRYEVEYKSGAALQIARAALELLPAQLGEFIRCTVYSWFIDRDVPPAFEPKTDTPGLVVRSEMKQSTAKRKLAWLNTQVRPTVQYLFEQGLRRQALDALEIELVEINEVV